MYQPRVNRNIESRQRWYIPAMAHSLPLPPTGFDALSVEEQIDYVQSLWDRIAATVDQVPSSVDTQIRPLIDTSKAAIN